MMCSFTCQCTAFVTHETQPDQTTFTIKCIQLSQVHEGEPVKKIVFTIGKSASYPDDSSDIVHFNSIEIDYCQREGMYTTGRSTRIPEI